jgi:hypothetical protein
MSLRADTRGLANRLIIFGGFLIVAALLTLTLNPAVAKLENQTAAQTTTSQGQEGLAYVSTAWDYAPLITLMLAVVFLIAGALLESRGGV